MFALGALILSVCMGALSYFTTRHFLVAERESASVRDAYANATIVSQRVRDKTQIVPTLTAVDQGTPRSHSLLERQGTWYERSFLVRETALPSTLRALVGSGVPASQTYYFAKDPQIAVGVPIPQIHAAYYVVFDIADLAHTLRVLALALFGAGAVTTVLGAVLGRWASGRSLRPLASVSRAAVAIAGGDLETRLVGTARDRDLAGLSASFNRMVDQLQERIEREERFTSDVSHELRSPLTTLAASLAVLEAKASSLSPAGRHALDLLSEDVRRFQRMVGDLLEISRSDAGASEMSMEEVEPGELVREAVNAAQRTLGATVPPPEVAVDPALASTHLWVDKRRFERVISNLLENAFLYGGGATAVHVGPGERSPKMPNPVRISVEDAGPGLPSSERTRVFERFYRGHAAFQRGAGKGTGLGLALVAEHIRRHGGRVWAEEVEGGGARFTIELPGYLADEAETPETDPEVVG